MVERHRGALVIALGLVVGFAGTACRAGTQTSTFTTTTPPKVQVLGAQTIAATDGIPAPTRLALAALSAGPTVDVHAAPGSPDVALTLRNPTMEFQPLAFFVLDRQDDWLHVRLPERPNGLTGWVKADQVQLSEVESRIVVSVGQRSLRVLDKNQKIVYETNVAVGTPRTPTPLGRFYVDVWLPKPGSPYGAFLLSIAGFSEVLKSFNGGRGQIAMHGWSDPSAMGRDVSNGCIRMRNADITHVASLAPLGTPVEIVP